MAVAEYPPFNDDPVLLYETMQTFAAALGRRRAKIAAGIHVDPPAYCQCTEASRAASRRACREENVLYTTGLLGSPVVSNFYRRGQVYG